MMMMLMRMRMRLMRMMMMMMMVMMMQGEGGAGSLRRDWGELAGNSKVEMVMVMIIIVMVINIIIMMMIMIRMVMIIIMMVMIIIMMAMIRIMIMILMCYVDHIERTRLQCLSSTTHSSELYFQLLQSQPAARRYGLAWPRLISLLRMMVIVDNLV